MALTMMASTPAFASNLTYNFSGASAGNFGKSTSIDPVTTIGADSVNRDISKNSAFIPPEFGSPQADILGTGELLTPDISGVEPMFPHSTQANYRSDCHLEWCNVGRRRYCNAAGCGEYDRIQHANL